MSCWLCRATPYCTMSPHARWRWCNTCRSIYTNKVVRTTALILEDAVHPSTHMARSCFLPSRVNCCKGVVHGRPGMRHSSSHVCAFVASLPQLLPPVPWGSCHMIGTPCPAAGPDLGALAGGPDLCCENLRRTVAPTVTRQANTRHCGACLRRTLKLLGQ